MQVTSLRHAGSYPRAHRHLRGPYVFCDQVGARLTHSMVKRVVPTTCRKAKLAKRITSHGLRHTFASHLVMRGKSLKAVQELLGHESIEMTLRYSHLTPDVRREAVQALDDAPPARSGPATASARWFTTRCWAFPGGVAGVCDDDAGGLAAGAIGVQHGAGAHCRSPCDRLGLGGSRVRKVTLVGRIVSTPDVLPGRARPRVHERPSARSS